MSASPPPPPRRGRAAVVLCLLLAGAWVAAAAPPEGSVALPGVIAETREGATVLQFAGESLVYVEGLGWLAGFEAPPPVVVEGVVYAAPVVAAALGLPTGADPPQPPVAGGRLVGVRVAGGTELRVVLDVEGLGPESLRALGAVGRVEAGGTLRLDLPPLAAPAELPDRAGAVDLRWRFAPDGGSLELAGVGFAYEVFALGFPTRLVIDVRPDRDGVPVPVEEVVVLKPGVVYRTFRASGSGGPSRVHLIEVAPGAGEWRVVGGGGETRPTLAWADGAFAAINGGYFDTGSRNAIGLLVVDGHWISPPSRGRAAVGFGPDGVVIDRVRTRASVWVDDHLVVSADHEFTDRIAVHGTPNGWAGAPDLGALLLDADGAVLGNRVGPVRVPAGGQVVVYPPEVRGLAIADVGSRVRTAISVEPATFAAVRYAVEAGPLLIKGGVDAFAPDREAFARGVRILDDVTQQAAIGVRADGTVLLVAAEAMVAADLVPLLLRLGAVEGMRLDSGGSTTLVADGRVLNRRTERAVVNAIVWRPEARP